MHQVQMANVISADGNTPDSNTRQTQGRAEALPLCIPCDAVNGLLSTAADVSLSASPAHLPPRHHFCCTSPTGALRDAILLLLQIRILRMCGAAVLFKDTAVPPVHTNLRFAIVDFQSSENVRH